MYLKYLEKNSFYPNFWCSEDYFKFAGWKEILKSGYVSVVDSDNQLMLPVLTPLGIDVLKSKYWVGFKDLSNVNFIDHEFIYDPKQFFNLEGSKWRKVRKQINQCLQDIDGPVRIFETFDSYKVVIFFTDWIRNRLGSKWYDLDVMCRYIKESSNTLYITDVYDLLGLCIWDENYKYVNFRYCLVKPGIRGLSTLCRIQFYKYISQKNKLVNDGGSLDKESLYRYKMSLNPHQMNKIYGGLCESK